MAMELEEKIMKEIGFGQHYSRSNGSGSCGYLREEAVKCLPSIAESEGLQISDEWISLCETANSVDNVNSDRYGLTNTWIACSDAIQDAIYRSTGGEGFSPTNYQWTFHSDAKRSMWENRNGMMARALRWESLHPQG